MITHYLKIALRNLWKYKTQSIISIVGLSLGFLSFMLCNYYVQYHLFFNTQIPNSDRIYKLNTSLKESDLSKEFPEIEKILPLPTPYGITGLQVDCTINIEDKDISHQVFISNMLDPSFIDFFSLSIIYGTKEIIAHPNGSIVLFESEAKKLTENTASLIGKEVKMDNKSYFITGILKNPPVNSTFGGIKSIYFLTGQKSLVITYPDQNNKYAYCIQLNKTASKSNFLNKLEHYFNKNKNENETENKYELEPFTGLSNFSEYSINIGKFLFTFGLLILLASLFNFILLQFSMYYNHFREYGIRIVNGMNGWQLTLQLFTDIMIRFLLSGVIVFIIIESSLHNFERIYSELTYINLDLHLLMQHLMKYILYGTALSFVLSYILSHNLLKRSIRSVSGYLLQRNDNNRGRNILLFLQMLVIIFFISAAGIVKLQVNSMKSNIFSNFTRNERENIISFRCNYPQLRGKHDILLQKISNSTDVLDVTGSEEEIIRGYYLSDAYKIVGFEDKIVRDIPVAFNFCNFFNGHIIQGNTFEKQDDYDAAIVNENFLKLFPGESVIGKTFCYEYSGKTYRVIGVIDNIQLFLEKYDNNGVEEPIDIMKNEIVFFQLLPKEYVNYLYVQCKQGKTKEVKQHIETCLREFIPEGYSVEFETLQKKIDDTFSAEKLIEYSSGIFFIISLSLGLLGIYSSVLTSAEKRRKEIAIRKINGAELKDIIILFGKTYFALWTFACFISFPFIYYYAAIWLERYKNHITLNILLFVMIYIAILVFIALIVIFQIIKTVKSNPSDVIKKE